MENISSLLQNVTVDLLHNITVDIHPILPEIPLKQEVVQEWEYAVFGIFVFSVLGLFAGFPFLYAFYQLLKWVICVKIPKKLEKKKKFNIIDCTGDCDCRSKKNKNSRQLNCTGEMEIVQTIV